MTSDNRPWLITCLGVATDLPLLPHFLHHYTALGVEPARMIVILNALSPEEPALATAREMLEAAGTGRVTRWIAPYTSETMWQERRAVQERFCTDGAWVLSADVDEFHEYPEPLPDMLARAAALEASCIQGVFIDRLAPGGAMAAVTDAPEILRQFPIEAEVTMSIGKTSAVHGRGGTVKLMAIRPHVLPRRGGHGPMPGPGISYLYNHALGDFPQIDDPSFRFAVPTQVHHIHWTGTLLRRLETRLATPGVSPAGAEYGRRQIDHIRAHGGIDLNSVALRHGTGSEDWPAALARMRRVGRRNGLRGSLRAIARKAMMR